MQAKRVNGLEVGFLWLCLVMGMVLHFNYEVSGIRYGVDFVRPGADGVVPLSNFAIKAVFYVLPLLLAVGATGSPGRPYRAVNLVLSSLFAFANAMHLIMTARGASDVLDYAQVLLLTAVLLANVQLIRLSSRWRREPLVTNNA